MKENNFLLQRSTRVSMESRYRHLLPSLDWSRSRHPANFPVSMSLSLDIYKIFQSRWVSVSTSVKFPSLDESRYRPIFRYQSRTKFCGLVLHSLGNFCFSLDVFVVSVSVSTLRLRPFQSRSWSRHWHSDLFSLGLSLVIETQTFSVSVSVSSLRLEHFQSRSRSRWSKSGLVDPCSVRRPPE